MVDLGGISQFFLIFCTHLTRHLSKSLIASILLVLRHPNPVFPFRLSLRRLQISTNFCFLLIYHIATILLFTSYAHRFCYLYYLRHFEFCEAPFSTLRFEFRKYLQCFSLKSPSVGGMVRILFLMVHFSGANTRHPALGLHFFCLVPLFNI